MIYSECVTLLDKRSSKKLANNTYLKRESGYINGKLTVRFALYLHGNLIAQWENEDTIAVGSAGWFTKTTANRLSRFALPSTGWALQCRVLIDSQGTRVPLKGFLQSLPIC